MKKLYTLPEYKRWHKRRQHLDRNPPKKKKTITKVNRTIRGYGNSKRRLRKNNTAPILAPNDFRVIENTEKCLLFFRQLRSEDYITHAKNAKFIIISLRYVEYIDYGTISILTAISDDLKYKGITLKGDFPDNPECKKIIIDSGFLNHMYDDKTGKAFPKAEKSDLIFFEKGCGVLSDTDNRKISLMVKNVVNHLTGESKYCLPVKTIILEICGNSIEWGGTDNKQWLLGVKYEEGGVIFTVSDVGKGILDTLHKKYRQKLKDIFTLKSNDEILKGAFNQKYGSSTQEVNRNKGLPSVRVNFEQGTIKELKVLTNNVILHFDNDTLSRAFEIGSPRFKGTFYQWVITEECINNISMN